MKSMARTKRYWVITIWCLSLSVASTVVGAFFLSSNLQQLIESGDNRYQSFLIADELRQSSDDLTRMVRTFAATGDRRFEKQFNTVLAIRNGEWPRPLHYSKIYWDLLATQDILPGTDGQKAALHDRMVDQKITDEERGLLKLAQNQSDALVSLEKVAMRAINNALTTEDAKLRQSGESSRDMAIRLLHGREYHEAKALIMAPLQEFLIMLDERTNVNYQHHANRARILGVLIVALIIVTIGLASIAVHLRRTIRNYNRGLLSEKIDELNKRTEELALSEAIVSHTSDMMLIADRDYRYRVVNQAFLKRVERKEDQVIGRSIAEIRGEKHFQEFARPSMDLALSGERHSRQNWFDFPHLGQRFMDVQYEPMRSANGDITKVIVTARDLTEVKNAESAMDESKEHMRAARAAEASNRAKSQFLANMSHEIRTPMNGVVGMVDILRRMNLTPDQHRIVDTIKASAFSLMSIIDDILDASKIEAGKLELEWTAIDLTGTIESIAETIVPLASEKNVRVWLFLDPELPKGILSDPVRLRQILLNLLSNAVKFSRTDKLSTGELGRVEIRVDLLQESTVQFKITDNGLGMDQHTIDRLFKPFNQAEESTTRKFGGTGLGLVISKSLVELMRGTITVDSTLGKGSTFTIQMPFDEAEVETPQPDIANLELIGLFDEPALHRRMGAFFSKNGGKYSSASNMTELSSMIASSDAPPIVILGCETQAENMSAFDELSSQDDGTRFLSLCPLRDYSMGLLAPNHFVSYRFPMHQSDILHGIAVLANREDTAILPAAHLPATIVHHDKSILLVEDNETNQDVITRQLHLLGYDAEVAADGRQGLEMWKQGRFDLVLTDCHMPEMDGYQMTHLIRMTESKDKLSRMPIIAITANAMKGEVERCLTSGMDDYLSKPVELDRFEQVLGKWLPTAGEAQDLEKISEPEESPSESVIDRTMLTAVVGDDPELHRKLLTKFVDQAFKTVQEIDDAIAASSTQQVGELGHKLKSSARTIGANALADLCQELEVAGKGDDREKTEALHLHLGDRFNEVKACIEST